jgi:ABC-type multidrug transport system fused ATPase/permease subunit
LWDGREYCRKCVEGVSTDLFAFAVSGSRLEETLNRGDVTAIHFLWNIGRWCLIGIVVVFSVPLTLALLAGDASVWSILFFLGFLVAFGAVFLSLQAVLGAFIHRRSLPRTLSLDDGELRIVTPKVEKRIKISDCKWYSGSTAADQACMFTRLRRGVIIQTPEEQIAVGHAAGMRDHWQHFLALARIKQNPPRGCLRLLMIAILGMAVGIILGSGIGAAVAWLTKNPIWQFTLGFMGVIEGAAVALIYITCTSEGAEAARKRLHPGLLALVFFVLGVKFGILGGLPGALVCGAFNSVFGAILGWFCRKRIAADERM